MDEYDFDVKPKAKANVVADCLSRYSINSNPSENIEENLVFMLRSVYEKFAYLKNNSQITNHNVIETRDNINSGLKAISKVIFTPKRRTDFTRNT